MRIRFDGKTVVVSGAGHGFGRCIAETFAQLGARVFGCDLCGAELAETAKAGVDIQVLDLTDPSQHGLASSLVVLARTLGMVIGLASLTAFGLSRFQRIFAERSCDSVSSTGGLRAQLTAFETCVRGALLQEYREIFLVAAAICLLGAVVALLTLGASRERLSEPHAAAPA